MLEKLLNIDKIDILKCQELAKDTEFDKLKFDLCGPKGKIKAKWLDAYFGLFEIEGQKGFLTIEDFKYNCNIWCENLRLEDD